MDATTGLQMSQPIPVPWRAMSPEKVRTEVAEMISKSSARDTAKCSHNALDCSTPSASSSCLSNGTHDPHDVPALVQAFSAGTSAQPLAIASVTSPLVTLLHEQICAAPGSAPTPSCAPPESLPLGTMIPNGSPGRCSPTIGRSMP